MSGEIIIHEPRSLSDGSCLLSATLRPESGEKIWYQELAVYGDGIELDRLDNTGDVWAILFMHKMMEYGGKYRICSSISASLIPSLDRYARVWARLRPELYRPVVLLPDEVMDDSQRRLNSKALTCFSGGLDACFTAFRHAKGLAGSQNMDIQACLMVHGADIRKDYLKEWNGAALAARELADDLGIARFYTVSTNFRDMHCAYGMSYASMLVAVMKLFGREYGHLILGSDDPCHHFTYPWGNNPVTNHFFSSHGSEVVTDGLEYTRTEKAVLVAQWPLALQKLRVCYQGKDLSSNCGVCPKCRRTRLNFLAAGIGNLPCMPLINSEDELFEDELNEGEYQELSLIIEYLDVHPIIPRPEWETRLRKILALPPKVGSDRVSMWSRFCLVRKKLSGLVKLQKSRNLVSSFCRATGRFDSKSEKEIMRELRQFVMSGKAFPIHSLIHAYFLFRLQYRGSQADRYVFESEWLQYFTPLMRHSGKEYDILENKESAWQALSRRHLPVTKRLGLLCVDQGLPIVEKTVHGESVLLQRLLEEYGSCFVKPADGMKGMGCMHITPVTATHCLVNGMETSYLELAGRLEQPLLVEEVVRQHPHLAIFHPESLNTLRLVTMRRSDGKSMLICGMLRVGVGSMHVDNLSSGGLAVGIRTNGRLRQKAWFVDPVLAPLEKHPDTGIIFSEREIPYFQEAVEIVTKAHDSFSRIHSVGWDVAITETGPVIIETNCSWGMLTIQIVDHGLRNICDHLLRPAALALKNPSPFKKASFGLPKQL